VKARGGICSLKKIHDEVAETVGWEENASISYAVEAGKRGGFV